MLAYSEIQNRVITIVATISGIPRDEISADSAFDKLELDSLSRIEVLVELEREFEIETPDGEDDEDLVKRIQSVEHAARLVEKSLADKKPFKEKAMAEAALKDF